MKRGKIFWESLCIAFSMFSKIPVPKVEWKEENMSYMVCFFPLVGAVIGGLCTLFLHLACHFDLSPSIKASVLTALPVLVTGGIHLDGLLDTADAVSSWGSREKRMEILKDSHTGAFAVIWCGLYLVLFYGAASAFTPSMMAPLTLVFVLSRALSGLALALFPKAKTSGLLYTFSRRGKTSVIAIVMYLYLLFCGICLLCLSLPGGLILLLEGAFCIFLYYRTSLRMFGGITGDLAGCFLCVTELVLSLTIASLSGLW